MMLASSTAWAWSSFEYRSESGEYRYGVRDGSSKLYLGLKKRKQAEKTAKALNKADKVDEKAQSESSGDK